MNAPVRIRTLLLGTVLAALAIVPTAAPAAQGMGIYAFTGTLLVNPTSNEGPGTWSMAGPLSLQLSAGAPGPKTGKFTAGGLIGAVSVPNDPCLLTATTGAFSISWAGGMKSTGGVIHVMNHPAHAFLVTIRTGYRAGTRAVIVIRHRPNNHFSGYMAGPHPEPPT